MRRTRIGNLWLLIVSYVFYGWWNPLYLVLIAYATTIDYTVVARMEKSHRKRIWLAVSIINNLGLLSLFKYANFVTINLSTLLSWCGSSYTIPDPGLLLPIGLSFYLFKSIGYTVDCYRGNVEREKNFITYAVFVSFFPILLGGPIERAGNLLPQLKQLSPISRQDIADGLSLFMVGLFKKVALADYLGLYVDKVYDAPDQYQSPVLILATFAFTWQIYFDFSGYTDMARGIARMMGFRLMLNFNNPYLATSLGDFWRRWHISLSCWFRDYVYIPMGGNRKGAFNTYRNLFLAMVISGLWHGAAWTFIIWGALHGFGSILTRKLERSAFYSERVPKLVKQLLVFVFVTFAWIFFRAASFEDAYFIVMKIFSWEFADPAFPVLLLIMILAVWLYQYAYESRVKRILMLAPVRIGVFVIMIVYLTVFTSSGGQGFIYNQF
ncbi:MAG: MBOAT family O-acyltransferase [Planctomycetota bacterium]